MIKNLKLKIKNCQPGFTLIELLVVIAVIAVLSSIMLVDFSGAEKALALKRAAYQLAQDIRETEEMALSSAANVSCSAGKNICGFGIYFQYPSASDHYVIFADCASDCQNSNHTKDSNDTEIRQIFLEKAITFKPIPPMSLNLVFTAPDPIVWINNNDWGAEAQITIQTQDNETRNIKVNSAGRVEIE